MQAGEAQLTGPTVPDANAGSPTKSRFLFFPETRDASGVQLPGRSLGDRAPSQVPLVGTRDGLGHDANRLVS